MTIRRDIYSYPVVYIFCRSCDGWWYMAVDMPGNKREIQRALYDAHVRGDRVQRFESGNEAIEQPRPGNYCKCQDKKAEPLPAQGGMAR